MYCRNCGCQLNEKAVACTTCGLPPLIEKNFCYECGTQTNEKQVLCIKCGLSLDNNYGSSLINTFDKKIEYQGIYCSSDDKKIFGLCGGLAHKFGIQPSIIRLLTILSSFFIVGWLYFLGPFLPKHPTKSVS